MVKLKCKMFEESKKSTSSENIFINLIVFVFIFAICLAAESVVPTIMASPEISRRAMEEGVVGDFKKMMEISTEVSMQSKYLLCSLFCTILGSLTAVIYCRFVEARHLSSMGVRKKKAGIHYVQGLAVGLLMMTAAVLISAAFGINSIKLCGNINFGIIVLFAAGFFIQGMSEEFIFRGYLMNTLASRHNPWIAVLISSAAFSLAHLVNPGFNLLVFFNLSLFGVFAGLYMIAFDDIWGVCAIHSIWNFSQGNLFGISVSGTGETESVLSVTAVSSSKLLTGGDFGIEGSIVTTAVLLTGIIIVLVKIKKQGCATSEK
ncbi:MAG: CPBP family intramembrane metalloprotease [Ruminococcus sp.]|nr:CPBP family intramembrane metalloprotease [Ruminococcus sp.]